MSYITFRMNKRLIQLGQDLDRAWFYNLIVKVSDISTEEQFKDMWNELKYHGFPIYSYDENTIQAVYKDRYQKVADKFRELEKEGWKKWNEWSLANQIW